ncbi:unnamed protein product [Moneuplotes crassus]|uniref:Uncharacterized protein n=1 Tax=Euplotes crassus TaxID=5936 RepID=A0AAD1X9S6_EUPCR|nr:unnamed protein product [Moneuplotes crassus]
MYEFRSFRKTEMFCIDGFPREGLSSVGMYPLPMKGKYVYQGIKPSVVKFPEATDDIVGLLRNLENTQKDKEKGLVKQESRDRERIDERSKDFEIEKDELARFSQFKRDPQSDLQQNSNKIDEKVCNIKHIFNPDICKFPIEYDKFGKIDPLESNSVKHPSLQQVVNEFLIDQEKLSNSSPSKLSPNCYNIEEMTFKGASRQNISRDLSPTFKAISDSETPDPFIKNEHNETVDSNDAISSQ